MPSASLDRSTLYSTEHGTIQWTSDRSLDVALGERRWTFRVPEVRALHDAVQPLAAQVYRCNCDCRWQVRSDEQTIVLSTDEVLRLHSLLDGAMVMLELYSILDDVSIAQPR